MRLRRLRNWLRHHGNELHVYCRLRDCGLSHALATRLSAALGRVLRPIVYGAW